jgi:hypothetical protein
MKPGYVVLTRGTIENHLFPIFGRKDLPELREADCLRFASTKLDEGPAPKTIKNALSIVRCVCSLLERDGLLDRNGFSPDIADTSKKAELNYPWESGHENNKPGRGVLISSNALDSTSISSPQTHQRSCNEVTAVGTHHPALTQALDPITKSGAPGRSRERPWAAKRKSSFAGPRTCDLRFRKLDCNGARSSGWLLGAPNLAKVGKAWLYKSFGKLQRK